MSLKNSHIFGKSARNRSAPTARTALPAGFLRSQKGPYFKRKEAINATLFALREKEKESSGKTGFIFFQHVKKESLF